MEDPQDTSFVVENSNFAEGKASSFRTTLWTLVLETGQVNPREAAGALERLCGFYWYPIYEFIRRRGFEQHDAKDLTQGLFAHLIERETLKKVDRQKGKFRTFILAALTNFLNNEWDKHQTLKRGGKIQIISLDETKAEELYFHRRLTS